MLGGGGCCCSTAPVLSVLLLSHPRPFLHFPPSSLLHSSLSLPSLFLFISRPRSFPLTLRGTVMSVPADVGRHHYPDSRRERRVCLEHLKKRTAVCLILFCLFFFFCLPYCHVPDKALMSVIIRLWDINHCLGWILIKTSLL